jgi:hypothetical protein
MTNSLNKLLLGSVVTVGALVVGSVDASAANIKATVTADNFYGIYYGNEDGSLLNLVGRNETTDTGNPGRYNWSQAETWDFHVSPSDYLYLVTWDDGRVAESWIGEFEIAGNTVLTGADDWEYIVGGENPYLQNKNTNALPDNDELESFIEPATWLSTVSIGKNGRNPWGTIAGIASDADWLQTASHTEGKYTIFRTKVPAEQVADVPEPAAMLGLLAFGAVAANGARKKKTAV